MSVKDETKTPGIDKERQKQMETEREQLINILLGKTQFFFTDEKNASTIAKAGGCS